MTFEQRVRTYLHHKASTILVPPRTVQSLLKGVRLGEALEDLRSVKPAQDPEKTTRRTWWRPS